MTVMRGRRRSVPPAWTDVWICTDPRGHLQATGRDVRSRKQHRAAAALDRFRRCQRLPARISGADITAKDFRTWAATSLALVALARRVDKAPTKKAVVEMVEEVAAQLGNTPAVCRKCYIHPAVIESFATGKLAPFVALRRGGAAAAHSARIERALIRFLEAKGVPAA